jgi:3alpha(or 20beta)-hydroxysteroid dehydrogenase
VNAEGGIDDAGSAPGVDSADTSGSRLRGRIILISGAARGMGAAEARLFAASGADVVLGDMSDEDTAELAASIGERAVSCRLDVREETDWERALDLAVKRFGRPVSGMVNNAAIGGDGRPLVRTSLENYLKVVTTNQVGTFLGLKVCGGHMAEHGGGAIVTIGDGPGRPPQRRALRLGEVRGAGPDPGGGPGACRAGRPGQLHPPRHRRHQDVARRGA